jgi:hypothetical protein
MSGPRNRAAHARGQEHREQIKTAMLEHARRHPLAKPLSGAQLQAQFPHLGISTVFWHMSQIRAQADAEAAVDTLESV